MSKSLGNQLNDDLWRRLNGEDLEGCADKVILIATVDDEDRPHPAMLSYFEVVATDRRNIRMATYKDSRTTKNMRRNGKATISIIDERAAYYIKGSVDELSSQMVCAPFNSKLNLKIQSVLADEANEEFEPGAYISSGVMYYSPNRAKQLLNAKEVIRELMSNEE